MDFKLSEEEAAFREEVRAFLDENLPPDEQRDDMFQLAWQRKVREKRWVGFSWQREYGCGDLKRGLSRANGLPGHRDREAP